MRIIGFRLEHAPALALDILGIQLPTTADTMKKAFRDKSKKLHPDMGGDDEQFRELVEVYNFL